MVQRMMALIVLVLLWWSPVQGGNAVVKLPGTPEQIAFYSRYDFPAPEDNFIYYINENLLFSSIPTLAEADPWMWRGFKSRRRFARMVRTRRRHVQYETARTLGHRLKRVVKGHNELNAYLAALPGGPMAPLTLDLTAPADLNTARQILKRMGVVLGSDK
ncbi:MAG: hypothetical protein GY950_07890, partial [bacterium]|nr:hypothetical protein [bacterium]